MVNSIPVITIDGPSGSGKGTLGHLLAHALAWHFLDSGAIYRALAFVALATNAPLDDEQALAILAENLDVTFKVAAAGQPPQTVINGIDATAEIRSEICGTTASKIAAFPAVRQALLERQRQFRQLPGLVTDGRDMGSVVFPDAPLKVFLSATVAERARRRYQQLKERGINVSLDALCIELAERDRRDEQREIAPLKPMPDAMIIDTTGLSIQEVLQKVEKRARELFS